MTRAVGTSRQPCPQRERERRRPSAPACLSSTRCGSVRRLRLTPAQDMLAPIAESTRELGADADACVPFRSTTYVRDFRAGVPRLARRLCRRISSRRPGQLRVCLARVPFVAGRVRAVSKLVRTPVDLAAAHTPSRRSLGRNRRDLLSLHPASANFAYLKGLSAPALGQLVSPASRRPRARPPLAPRASRAGTRPWRRGWRECELPRPPRQSWPGSPQPTRARPR